MYKPLVAQPHLNQNLMVLAHNPAGCLIILGREGLFEGIDLLTYPPKTAFEQIRFIPLLLFQKPLQRGGVRGNSAVSQYYFHRLGELYPLELLHPTGYFVFDNSPVSRNGIIYPAWK